MSDTQQRTQQIREYIEIVKEFGKTTQYRGYDIQINKNQCNIIDSRINNFTSWEDLPCGHCGKYNTKEGHDGCIGTLIGTMNACCGHGKINEAYVQFLDGECVRGEKAITIINILKDE